MEQSSPYVKFLILVNNLRGTKFDLRVDSNSMQLLEVIVISAFKNKMMTITEVMNLRAISSPATLHRKLHNLVKAGLIELKFEKNNNRTKYVMLTKKTLRYYEKIDALMLKSIQ